MRTLFVAGASGAIGRTVLRSAGDVALRPHYRKAPDGVTPVGAVIGSLDDHDWLTTNMRGATTVLQLIGTIKHRFASGDTYETSDIATTQHLVDAARATGTVDHIVLLSSVGAGKPIGAYLKAKARAEAIVRDSGLAWTIVRPGFFEGEGHRAPLSSRILGLVSPKYAPISVEDVARALLHVATTREPLGRVLEGASVLTAAQAG